MKDYYYLLGLNRNASDDDIKKAYRKLSKKFHPDVNDGDLYFTERFKDIQEAYDILSDSKKKLNYDFDFSRTGEYSKNDNKSEFVIKEFSIDKSKAHLGDDIIIRWQTEGASTVSINLFGDVKNNGEIKYKFLNCSAKSLLLILETFDIKSNKKYEKTIILENLTYSDIYKEIYKDLRNEFLRKNILSKVFEWIKNTNPFLYLVIKCWILVSLALFLMIVINNKFDSDLFFSVVIVCTLIAPVFALILAGLIRIFIYLNSEKI